MIHSTQQGQAHFTILRFYSTFYDVFMEISGHFPILRPYSQRVYVMAGRAQGISPALHFL